MTEKQISTAKRTLDQFIIQTESIKAKLRGGHNEQIMKTRLSELQKEIEKIKDTFAKTIKPSAPQQTPKNRYKMTREMRLGTPLPEIIEHETPSQNTKCRHYCGDSCKIGMDMIFCSTSCAFCTNMVGSTKVRK